jgi:hypothetical protein
MDNVQNCDSYNLYLFIYFTIIETYTYHIYKWPILE